MFSPYSFKCVGFKAGNLWSRAQVLVNKKVSVLNLYFISLWF